LKHISRTAALAFLIDLSDEAYLDAFDILYKELAAFSADLIRKKRILVGTKLDLEGTAERLESLRIRYPAEEILGISVFSGQGIGELAALMGRLVDAGDHDTSTDTGDDGAANNGIIDDEALDEATLEEDILDDDEDRLR
jgi:GTP-binding protein